MRRLPLLVAFLSLPIAIVSQAAETVTCDGLPIGQAKTADRFCVGIVATGFKAPRAVCQRRIGE